MVEGKLEQEIQVAQEARYGYNPHGSLVSVYEDLYNRLHQIHEENLAYEHSELFHRVPLSEHLISIYILIEVRIFKRGAHLRNVGPMSLFSAHWPNCPTLCRAALACLRLLKFDPKLCWQSFQQKSM
jgi:hypothetical protein